MSNAIIVSMEEIFNIDSSLEYLIGLMESGIYAKIDDCGKWSIYNLAINVSRYTQRRQNECIVTPKLRNCPIPSHDTCKTRFSGVSWHKFFFNKFALFKISCTFAIN